MSFDSIRTHGSQKQPDTHNPETKPVKTADGASQESKSATVKTEEVWKGAFLNYGACSDGGMSFSTADLDS